MAKTSKQSISNKNNKSNKKSARKSSKRQSSWSPGLLNTRAKKIALLPFVLIFAAMGIYLLLNTKASTTFELVGTHPYAVAQSTASGKILTGMQEHDNKLYIGYGDTSANTGPIRVTAYDPATNSFTNEHVSATEAIWTYRPINSVLFAPSDDPQSDFSTDYTTGAPWNSVSSIRMTHNFDMAQLGTTLFAVGSRDVNAIVAKSTDGGASWSTVMTEAPISGDIARYYFAAVFNNKLYVQAYAYYNNKPHANSKVFDGANWSNGPNMLPLGGHGWHPKVHGTKLLYQTHLPNNMLGTSGNDKSRLMVFDGTAATSPLSSQIYDFAINGNYVYVLGVDGNIRRSVDLQNWTTIGSAPANSRSMAFLGTTMYVGTTDSKLYKLTSFDETIPPTPTPPPPAPNPTPPPPLDTVLPVVSITAPSANTTLNGNVTIGARATDNIAVTKLEIYVDGKLTSTFSTGTASQRWNTRKVATGPHNITSKAYDAAGNVGTTTITVNTQ